MPRSSDPRRPRRRPLERPVSRRIYRAAWALVAVPLLVVAFTVEHLDPPPAPRLDPSFDQATAVGFASDLARRFPDRSPGSAGARGATDWIARQLAEYGLKTVRFPFSAEVPGAGTRKLVNVAAVMRARHASGAEGASQALVVMAHRDNAGSSPGANDNASGTGVLLELARNAHAVTLAHTLVFLSTDGGALGGLGAAEFARHPEYLERMAGRGTSALAVVNLDSLGGSGRPRLVFAGDTARSPSEALLALADASVRAETGSAPLRPHAVFQLVDLAFPFSLYEQAPLVGRGVAAVTLTTAQERPEPDERDTPEAIDPKAIGAIGRAAQALLASLDEAGDAAGATGSYLYLGSRFVSGPAIQLLLLFALLPFLAAVLDLFARCRRHGVSLTHGLRVLRTRIALWAWAAALAAVFVASGLLPGRAVRPLDPGSEVARDWPVAALLALLALSVLGWVVVRRRLAPRRPNDRREELGGHLAAMLALAAVALVVAATNPYALVFVLPSLHAWLWLPHLAERRLAFRLGLFVLGVSGPLLLVGSFAVRLDLGLDAPWYLLTLAMGGYVPVPLLAAFLVWAAAAGQVGALVLRRFASAPGRDEPLRTPLLTASAEPVPLERGGAYVPRPSPEAGRDLTSQEH